MAARWPRTNSPTPYGRANADALTYNVVAILCHSILACISPQLRDGLAVDATGRHGGWIGKGPRRARSQRALVRRSSHVDGAPTSNAQTTCSRTCSSESFSTMSAHAVKQEQFTTYLCPNYVPMHQLYTWVALHMQNGRTVWLDEATVGLNARDRSARRERKYRTQP